MNCRNIKQDYLGDRQLHKYKAMELVRSGLSANQTLGLPYAINIGLLLTQIIKKELHVMSGCELYYILTQKYFFTHST